MVEDKMQKEPANYYLPRDVKDWLDEQSTLENRSPSNYLTTLLRRIRDTGKAI